MVSKKCQTLYSTFIPFILIDSVSFFILQRPYRYSQVIINKRIKNETDNTSSTGGAALLLAGVLLAGCDQSSSDEKHIKVGVINGAEQDVAEVAKR